MLIVTGVVGFLVLWFVVPYVIRKLEVFRLRRICRKRRAIVLTFDDGPSRSVTSKLLKLLAEYGARASFFALARKLETDPVISAQIAAEGHEIGSHSYEHLHAWKKSPLAVYRDIDRGLRLANSSGSRVWFRPPYGKITLATLLQVWMNRSGLAWWTIDSTDAWPTSRPVEAVLSDIRRQGGGVILLHDHDRSANLEREAYVLNMTRAILEVARNEGFKLCKLSDVYGS